MGSIKRLDKVWLPAILIRESHLSLRQRCWEEFKPASIMSGIEKCEPCQLVASCWISILLISYNDQLCKCTSIGLTWSRGLLQKMRYKGRIFRRDGGWKFCRQTRWFRYSKHWKFGLPSPSKAVASVHSYFDGLEQDCCNFSSSALA